MSDYFTYSALVANSLARSSDVNTRMQAVSAGFDMLPAPLLLQQNRVTFLTAGGTANALTASMSPTLVAYVAGLGLRLLLTNTNTGASTINVDGLGVKSIKRADGTALQASDLITGQIVDIVYDGTDFRHLGTQFVEMSAASLLTLLKTVDGSASGLDADLLRGTTPTSYGLGILAGSAKRAMLTHSANLSGDFTGAGTVLTWDTEIYDTAGFHDGVNPTRLTIPENGYARLFAMVTVDDTLSAAQHTLLAIESAGTGAASYHVGIAESYNDSATGNSIQAGTPIFPVTAGQYFTCRVAIESDTAVTLDKAKTYFAIEMVP